MCVCIHISSFLSLPPPPIQPLEVIIEGEAGFPVSYSSFPLAISHMVVCQCCWSFNGPEPGGLESTRRT